MRKKGATRDAVLRLHHRYTSYEIGAMLGLTDRAVRHHILRLGLKPHPRHLSLSTIYGFDSVESRSCGWPFKPKGQAPLLWAV